MIYPGHPRNPDAVLWVAVDAKGRNKERANDTTSTEEETKAETERIDALLRQIEAEHKLSADFMPPKRTKWLKRLKPTTSAR